MHLPYSFLTRLSDAFNKRDKKQRALLAKTNVLFLLRASS